MNLMVSYPIHFCRLLAALLVCLLPFATAAAGDLTPVLTGAMQKHSIPAMAVVVIRNGKIADEAAAGVKAAGAAAPVTLDDVWHIGSDTKAMTATMVARLVERGLLSWQTPLEKALPELADKMQPAYRDVTMIDMFAHQAGFKDLIDSDFYDAFYSDRRPLHEQRLDYFRMALAQPSAYAPRTDHLYSNRGAMLAATIAERATGLSYEDLMRREVFGPLGIRSAGFGPTHAGQPLGHRDGKPQTGTKADNPAVIAPAGGVHLTMRDWALFAIDQMKGESGQGELLRAENYRLLHRSVDSSVYALGWGVRTELNGWKGRFLTHSGSNGYWFARIVLLPETQSGILIAANAGPDAGADQAATEIEKALLPRLAGARETK